MPRVIKARARRPDAATLTIGHGAAGCSPDRQTGRRSWQGRALQQSHGAPLGRCSIIATTNLERSTNAYVDGLKMLARRELSEQQVRQRLARKGHDQDAIDDAVTRLREERAIDDVRVAESIARTETSVKRRGKLRVRLQIERAGIGRGTAKRAVDG